MIRFITEGHKGYYFVYCSLSEIGTLRDRIGTLRDRIGTLRDRIGTLRDRIGTLRDRIGTLRDRIGTLRDRIGTLRDRIGTLRDRICEGNSIIEAQSKLITDLEYRLKVKQNKLTVGNKWKSKYKTN